METPFWTRLEDVADSLQCLGRIEESKIIRWCSDVARAKQCDNAIELQNILNM